MKTFALKVLRIGLTVWVISVISFGISISAPGDPVSNNPKYRSESFQNTADIQEIRRMRTQLGLDLPFFYFGIQPAAFPDTLLRIPNPKARNSITYWLTEKGHWAELQKLHQSSRILIAEATPTVSKGILYLIHSTSAEQASKQIEILHNDSSSQAQLLAKDWSHYISMEPEKDRNRPEFKWNGQSNQYHWWLTSFLSGDMGKSYTDGLPITDKIGQKLGVSIQLILWSILLSFLVAIPVGLYTGTHPGSAFDNWTYRITMTWYAVPSFFVGTLLLLLFSNPDFLNILPVGGLYDPFSYNSEWPFYQRWAHRIPYLILPVFTYSYGLTAVLIRLFRDSVKTESEKLYITSARAKGLSEKRIRYIHIFKNASFPLITVLGRLLPIALGGSVIVESIFSIPGMGLGLYDAMLERDYPFIVAVFTLTGILTILGYGLSDLLYSIFDPRLNKKSSGA
jgi:peptide/nickel transport system permease protein